MAFSINYDFTHVKEDLVPDPICGTVGSYWSQGFLIWLGFSQIGNFKFKLFAWLGSSNFKFKLFGSAQLGSANIMFKPFCLGSAQAKIVGSTNPGTGVEPQQA